MGSDGVRHMWITGGTAAGTSLVAGAVAPTEAVSFGNKVIFAGSEKLWITDGTAGGTLLLAERTFLLGGTSFGLDPRGLTVFGDRVVFSAVDQVFLNSLARGMFATDGTVAGTVEVLGSNPQNTGSNGRSGLSPGEFTPLGDQLLFIGRFGNNRDIYVADESLSQFSILPFSASEIAALSDSHALFSTFSSLFITDGTSGGTSQLTVAGAGIQFRATGLTTVGDLVFFNALDSDGDFGLWISDGTNAGTVEIDVLAHAAGLNPLHITAFGDRAMFQGRNASGQTGLWITDGTAAGTHEIVVAGAHPGGLSPINLTLFDNRMLFNGLDDQGRRVLWVTDGTSAGTHTIDFAGAHPGESAPGGFGVLLDGFHWLRDWDFAWGTIATGDFNGDGTTDVMWAGGPTIGTWFLGDNPVSGALITGTLTMPEMPGWHTAATGDFNGDGADDVMWQSDSGVVGVWFMRDGIRIGTAAIQDMPGWNVIASGDFNGDNIDDVIWHNAGVLGGWMLDGNGQIGGTLQLPFFPDWTAIATGDYNGDGNTDILWQADNGLVAEWLMGDGTRQATAVIRDMPGWSALASVDFNGDGTDDVLWRTESGATAVWFMQDGQIAQTRGLESTLGKTLVAEGDFNGDGIGDLMWRDDVTAQIDVWTFDQNGLLV